MTKEKKLQLSLFINLLIVLFELMATDYDYKLNGMDMFLYFFHENCALTLIICCYRVQKHCLRNIRPLVSAKLMVSFIVTKLFHRIITGQASDGPSHGRRKTN